MGLTDSDTMNENGLFNPPHTHTTKIPHETPWDVRFALALLPARYLLRSFSNSAILVLSSSSPDQIPDLLSKEQLFNKSNIIK